LEGDLVLTEIGLDAGDQLHEERLDAERPRWPVDHQAEHPSLAHRQRTGGAARLEADLLGDREYALPGRRGHSRLTIEREGNRGLGHAGPLGDVGNRRPFHPVPSRTLSRLSIARDASGTRPGKSAENPG